MSTSTATETITPPTPSKTVWDYLPKWVPTSSSHLEQAEKGMLSVLNVPYETKVVHIKNGAYINTLKAGSGPPIVLVHGFGAGLGFWAANIGALSTRFTVYAIDLVGFGRSSRHEWKGKTSEDAEGLFVDSINDWAVTVGLKKFTLLGHSLGGYIAASYALKHPTQIQHLILADPWGVPQPDLDYVSKLPFVWKVVAKMVTMNNPLSVVRAVGPYGPKLVNRFRGDISRRWEILTEDTTSVSSYLYHLNAQSPPLGEMAFSALSQNLGWAKNPLIDRLPLLPSTVPTTFIYGERTWMDIDAGTEVCNKMKGPSRLVLIKDATHHLYIDNHQSFNDTVLEVADEVHLNLATELSIGVAEDPTLLV
eukprot:TRINITY_DN3320_c0_g2_i3.p1 TRINITY_DN3320_c0_g2~~TRINITY_DN3320_c0_g2_i3.p1  ORF type:complete len:364 (-),score=71.91 TRINITY_DN3320_c0_g2_i3:138-1229(-)